MHLEHLAVMPSSHAFAFPSAQADVFDDFMDEAAAVPMTSPMTGKSRCTP